MNQLFTTNICFNIKIMNPSTHTDMHTSILFFFLPLENPHWCIQHWFNTLYLNILKIYFNFMWKIQRCKGMMCVCIYVCVHACSRERERGEKEHDREIYSIHWFTFKMPIIARAGSGWSWGLGILLRSATWVTGTLVLGSSPAASLCMQQGYKDSNQTLSYGMHAPQVVS